MTHRCRVRAGPCFEHHSLRPRTPLLKGTWLLQPVPRTCVGRVVGHRRRGSHRLFRVQEEEDDGYEYAVQEERLRDALLVDRALAETEQVRTCTLLSNLFCHACTLIRLRLCQEELEQGQQKMQHRSKGRRPIRILSENDRKRAVAAVSRSSPQPPRGKPKSKSKSKKKRRPTKRQDFSQKRFKEGATKAMERFFGQNSYPTVEECAVRSDTTDMNP